MEQLHGNQRRVIELRFLEDRSVAETAAAMQISAGAMKALQHRALLRMAEAETEVAPEPQRQPRPSLRDN